MSDVQRQIHRQRRARFDGSLREASRPTGPIVDRRHHHRRPQHDVGDLQIALEQTRTHDEAPAFSPPPDGLPPPLCFLQQLFAKPKGFGSHFHQPSRSQYSSISSSVILREAFSTTVASLFSRTFENALALTMFTVRSFRGHFLQQSALHTPRPQARGTKCPAGRVARPRGKSPSWLAGNQDPIDPALMSSRASSHRKNEC